MGALEWAHSTPERPEATLEISAIYPQAVEKSPGERSPPLACFLIHAVEKKPLSRPGEVGAPYEDDCLSIFELYLPFTPES